MTMVVLDNRLASQNICTSSTMPALAPAAAKNESRPALQCPADEPRDRGERRDHNEPESRKHGLNSINRPAAVVGALVSAIALTAS